MLSVTNKPITLSVIMLNVIVLRVVTQTHSLVQNHNITDSVIEIWPVWFLCYLTEVTNLMLAQAITPLK
jgi:hypothetical protein